MATQADLVRRLARRHLRASATSTVVQDISGHLASITSLKDALANHASTMEALIAAGEARRLGRVSDIQVESADFNGSQVIAVVRGTTDKYHTRITINPKRGHQCTCPDWAKNGRRVGPCKHVLRLGQVWQEKVLDMLQTIETNLMAVQEKVSL